jgi:hypothetical protein
VSRDPWDDVADCGRASYGRSCGHLGPTEFHSLVGDGQVAPLLAVTGVAVVDAFGFEEGNLVVLFEAAREDGMFWG